MRRRRRGEFGRWRSILGGFYKSPKLSLFLYCKISGSDEAACLFAVVCREEARSFVLNPHSFFHMLFFFFL